MSKENDYNIDNDESDILASDDFGFANADLDTEIGALSDKPLASLDFSKAEEEFGDLSENTSDKKGSDAAAVSEDAKKETVLDLNDTDTKETKKELRERKKKEKQELKEKKVKEKREQKEKKAKSKKKEEIKEEPKDEKKSESSKDVKESPEQNEDGEKPFSLRKYIILSVIGLAVICIVLVIIYVIAMKNGSNVQTQPVKEETVVKEEEVSVDPKVDLTSFAHSAVFYNIASGYTHNLAESELEVLRNALSSNLEGAQISVEAYEKLVEDISNSQTGPILYFLIVSDKDGNSSSSLMLVGDKLYFEKTELEDTVWILSPTAKNTTELKTLMEKLALLEDMMRGIGTN